MIQNNHLRESRSWLTTTAAPLIFDMVKTRLEQELVAVNSSQTSITLIQQNVSTVKAPFTPSASASASAYVAAPAEVSPRWAPYSTPQMAVFDDEVTAVYLRFISDDEIKNQRLKSCVACGHHEVGYFFRQKIYF